MIVKKIRFRVLVEKFDFGAFAEYKNMISTKCPSVCVCVEGCADGWILHYYRL